MARAFLQPLPSRLASQASLSSRSRVFSSLGKGSPRALRGLRRQLFRAGVWALTLSHQKRSVWLGLQHEGWKADTRKNFLAVGGLVVRNVWKLGAPELH